MPAGLRLVVWRPLLLTAVAVARLPAQAEFASIRGFVSDTAGTPIPYAHVSVAGVRGISDSLGRFALVDLAPGNTTILVRRLGFAPRSQQLRLAAGRVDSVRVVLKTLARDLAGITTEATPIGRLAEFHRHRTNGTGLYLDRQQLEERRTPRLSDILRRMPGVRIVTDRRGQTHLRMGRSTGGRDCPPDYWVDGVRAQMLGVDDVPVTDIEALEVYRGPSGLPPEFNSRMGSPGCGAVVIWTRVPG